VRKRSGEDLGRQELSRVLEDVRSSLRG